MRLYLLLLLGSLLFATTTVGQSETKFSMEVSKSTVRVGEYFDVKFVLENLNNGKFTPPDWEQAGFIAMSSGQSSSFSFNNGVSSSIAVYKYQVMARDTGSLEIPAGVVKIGAEEKYTEPLSIQVLLGNADTIQQQPRNEGRPKTPSKDPKSKIPTIHL